jgi:hypothetical protein
VEGGQPWHRGRSPVPDREVLFGAGLGAWNGADTATAIDSDKLVTEVSPFSSAVTEPPSPDVEPGSYALLQFPYHIARRKGYCPVGPVKAKIERFDRINMICS